MFINTLVVDVGKNVFGWNCTIVEYLTNSFASSSSQLSPSSIIIEFNIIVRGVCMFVFVMCVCVSDVGVRLCYWCGRLGCS